MAALLLNPNVSFCRLLLFLLRMRSWAAFSCFLISRSRDIFCSVNVLLSSTIAKRSSAYMVMGKKWKQSDCSLWKWSNHPACFNPEARQVGWLAYTLRIEEGLQTFVPHLSNKQITTVMIIDNLRDTHLKILTYVISLENISSMGLDKKQEQWKFPRNVFSLPCLHSPLPPPSPHTHPNKKP